MHSIPPQAVLPVHRRPYPRYGCVLAGRLQVSNEDRGKVFTFSKGDFIPQSAGQWHTATNPGDVMLNLLVIDQAPRGELNVGVKNR